MLFARRRYLRLAVLSEMLRQAAPQPDVLGIFRHVAAHTNFTGTHGGLIVMAGAFIGAWEPQAWTGAARAVASSALLL